MTDARAIDLNALWDYRDPAASEARLREALAGARGDDALILQTQIARSFGLRRDFERARALLREIEPQLPGAGPEARVRYQLELGRTQASATHTPQQITPQAAQAARQAFEAAARLAREARLDALQIDAIHMMAFLDPAPAEQLHWGREALAVVLATDQPAARRWEASVRHNIGLALHGLGRHAEALQAFEASLALREQGSNAEATRVARWMVAWTLRSLQRSDEALAIQLRLEREGQAAGQPDPHVFDELAALYRALGDSARAAHYATLAQTARQR
ncbi:MAG: tetratricopeptide repeat protein [Rubrivivax sp.]|nr:tetratricopeptide repeat protein [Rubrivivax sp.]